MADETTTRKMVFSVPEGGEVLITYPEPMTPDSILMVEELCAIWFRVLHRRAIQRSRQDDAEVEYASWFPVVYDVTPTVNEHGETPEPVTGEPFVPGYCGMPGCADCEKHKAASGVKGGQGG